MKHPRFSIGLALPAYALSQPRSASEMAAMCCQTAQQQRVFAELYRRSQVGSRHSVLLRRSEHENHGPLQDFFDPSQGAQDFGPGTSARMAKYVEHAAPLAAKASRSALEAAALPAERIGHVVSVSCTGFSAPGVDVQLIKALGLPADTPRTQVGFMGCHGAFNGLRVAGAMLPTLPADRSAVLVAAVELCSLHFAYGWDRDRIVANALFADGAGAAVLQPPAQDSQQNAGLQLWSHHSMIVPDSEDAMTWNIGDHGFGMTLSPRVPELIQSHLRQAIEPWLARHGLSLAEIGSWAVHPGGPRVLSSVAQALSLPEEQLDASRQVLAECGNMSSPTILFILERLRKAGAKRPCVALGFGPGLTVEAMLLA